VLACTDPGPSRRGEHDPIPTEVVGYGAQNNYRTRSDTAVSNECPWYVWRYRKLMVDLDGKWHHRGALERRLTARDGMTLTTEGC